MLGHFVSHDPKGSLSRTIRRVSQPSIRVSLLSVTWFGLLVSVRNPSKCRFSHHKKRGSPKASPLILKSPEFYCSALSVFPAVADGLKRITPDSSTKKWRVPEDVVCGSAVTLNCVDGGPATPV